MLESSSIADKMPPNEGLTMHRVVKESGEYMTLSDGHIYCKRSGAPKSYFGHPMFKRWVALTEGNAMFASWAAPPHEAEYRYDLPHRTGSIFQAWRPSLIKQLSGYR